MDLHNLQFNNVIKNSPQLVKDWVFNPWLATTAMLGVGLHLPGQAT